MTERRYCEVTLNKKFLLCNILFSVLFLAAYSINRNIMILAAVIPCVFILFTNELSFCIAELLFLLPFSVTLTISMGTTSLFMLPKLALIVRFLIFNKGKIGSKVFVGLIFLFLYSIIVNLFKTGFPLVRVINLLLWFFIAYLIIKSLKTGRDMVIACSAFVGGVILSGVIGLLKGLFPNLSSELISAQYLNEDSGDLVQRFAGLWNDPNGYTAFLICALFAAYWLLKNRKIKVILFSVLAVTTTALGILTLSKSCALLLVGFWIYFLLSNQGMGFVKKVGAVVLIGALCILGASFYTNELSELIYRFTSAGGESFNLSSLTTHRSTIWSDYLRESFNGDFFFGFGIDAPLVGGYACHNTYLQLLYEWGMVGITVYLITWIAVIRQPSFNRTNIVAVLFLLVTIFFISCTYIEFLYFLLPFMICIGRVKSDEKTYILSTV